MADKPVTREEKYLAYLTGDYTGELPKPITRKEKYLYELCLKGIGGEISPEEIKNAVNEYLEKNPVKPGATTEQAQQIEQNKADVAALKEETGSLKEEIGQITDVSYYTDTIELATNLTSGYIDANGTLSSSSVYSHSTKIAVKEGDSITVRSTNLEGSVTFEQTPMRFVCAYKGETVVAESGYNAEIKEYIVPHGVDGVIISINAEIYRNNTIILGKKLKKITVKETAQPQSVYEILKNRNMIYSKILQPNVLFGEINKLENSSLELEDNAIAKNKVLCFKCDFISFNGVLRIGHGKNTYNGSFVEITQDKVSVYKYSSKKELQKEYIHALTLSGYVIVVIKVGADNKINFSMFTRTGMFNFKDIYWTGRSGKIFAETENMAITNIKLNWYCNDYKKSIYAFGDSYFDVTDVNRWTSYLLSNGYDNLLLDCYGGRKSEKALESFKNSLKHGTPKYALWCMGMNDPDDINNGVNTSWKTATDSFISICKQNNIIPILSTIPNVKGGAVDDTQISTSRTNTYKNNYVKSMGLRYIDFADAVGSNDNPNWYPGMLSGDGVHPADLGAKALYMKAVSDFPELLYEN